MSSTLSAERAGLLLVDSTAMAPTPPHGGKPGRNRQPC